LSDSQTKTLNSQTGFPKPQTHKPNSHTESRNSQTMGLNSQTEFRKSQTKGPNSQTEFPNSQTKKPTQEQHAVPRKPMPRRAQIKLILCRSVPHEDCTLPTPHKPPAPQHAGLVAHIRGQLPEPTLLGVAAAPVSQEVQHGHTRQHPAHGRNLAGVGRIAVTKTLLNFIPPVRQHNGQVITVLAEVTNHKAQTTEGMPQAVGHLPK
jgi:hypothetical protein